MSECEQCARLLKERQELERESEAQGEDLLEQFLLVKELRAELEREKERANHAVDQYLKDQLPEGKESWGKVWNDRVELTKKVTALEAELERVKALLSVESEMEHRVRLSQENKQLRSQLSALMDCAKALQGFLGDGDIEKEIADARKALTALPEKGIEI